MYSHYMSSMGWFWGEGGYPLVSISETNEKLKHNKCFHFIV